MDTTVAEEKKFNPRLTKSKPEFVNIMKNLNLAYPAQIGRCLAERRNCAIDFTTALCCFRSSTAR